MKAVKGVVLKKYKLTQDRPNYLLSSRVLNLIPHFFFCFFRLVQTSLSNRSETEKPDFRRASFWLAERAGFEPAVPFPVRQFSKLFLSATQAPLRTGLQT